jgi:serine/threonine-protein kinase
MEYVAIDFYDGSVLYDFAEGRTMICDIDFYRKRPYTNCTGRMWGSTRFMSPEEFELGATIDQRTNVFTMGATAFSLLGGTLDRSRERWTAGDRSHEVALKAVSPLKEDRHSSIGDLYDAWMACYTGSRPKK